MMDSFLNIGLKAMRRHTAGYDASQLQQELDDFARPWRMIFSFWFAAVLFGVCVAASFFIAGSTIWFGVGIITLVCVVPLPYLLQHHILENLAWNVVPHSLQPLVTELQSFVRGERIVILFGLASSTALNMLVLPALYLKLSQKEDTA